MVGKTRFARQGKTGKAGIRGLLLLPCPERQGSGGIQPADGWSWFQGWNTFGQGCIRAERPLCRGGLPRGGSPCRSVRAEAVKAWSRRRLWSLLCAVNIGTMYNRAIQAFSPAAAVAGDVRRSQAATVSFMGVPGRFCPCRAKRGNPHSEPISVGRSR